MDAKKVELLGHHCCLCTQLPFRITWAAFCTGGRTEGPYRSNGGSGTPHHSAGSASLLSARPCTRRTTRLCCESSTGPCEPPTTCTARICSHARRGCGCSVMVGLAAELVPREIEGAEYDSFIAFRDAP